MGLHMRNIVEHQSTDRDVLEIVEARRRGSGPAECLAQLVVVGVIGQRDVGEEAAGLVLQGPEREQVVRAVRHGLHVSIQHGAVRGQAEPVGLAMHRQPFLTGEEWLSVHREAHRLGLPSNCTMLYGHVETMADRADHLLALRALQDETGGFLTYIPLAYHPDHNELGEALGRTGTATSGFDDLKNIAIGRLVLDNIPHVKTHWPMVTPFISQVALTFGCDDLEGTVVFERVYHEAGAGTPMWLSYDQIVDLIRGAGKEPVERDSLYRVVRTFEDWVPGAAAARPQGPQGPTFHISHRPRAAARGQRGPLVPAVESAE